MHVDYIRGGKQKNYYSSAEVVSWKCPLCHHESGKLIDQERGSLQIKKCFRCNLIRVDPRVAEPEQIYWGKADIYFEESRLVFEGRKKHHRNSTYTHDLKILKKVKPHGKLLDVGCNMGFFLKKAVEFGYEGYGVDPSPTLSQLGREYLKLNIETNFLEKSSFNNNSFDIITMTDVFEHVVNPQEILSKAKSLLKKDGIILVKVPNARFNLLKWFVIRKCLKNSTYDIFDSYEHVVHYTESTLRKMLSQNGFQVIKFYIAPPIQIPSWHKHVGHYYQHATPFYMDFHKKSVRLLCYWFAKIEKTLSNRCGYTAPNIGVIARVK